MSWEIYVSTFRDGVRSAFETADLRAVFERGTVPQPAWPPRNTDFMYDDGHIRLDIADLGSRGDSFVARRIFGQTAIARLLEVSVRFNGLICWPAGDTDACLAVASEATLAHLPRSAVEEKPVVTDTPAAFIEAVGFSSQMTKQDWLEAQAEYERRYDQYERKYRPK